jgi:hypothetical protein
MLPDLGGGEEEDATLSLMVPLTVTMFDEFRNGAP